MIAASAFAATPEETAIVSVLKAYRAALNAGNTEQALALTATFPSVSPKETRQSTQELVDAIKSGTLKLWIYSSSVTVSGDCAVVVIGDGENPTPDDPAYLLRQEGNWRVFPRLAQWDELSTALTLQQRETFTRLGSAYKEAKKELRRNAESKANAE